MLQSEAASLSAKVAKLFLNAHASGRVIFL